MNYAYAAPQEITGTAQVLKINPWERLIANTAGLHIVLRIDGKSYDWFVDSENESANQLKVGEEVAIVAITYPSIHKRVLKYVATGQPKETARKPALRARAIHDVLEWLTTEYAGGEYTTYGTFAYATWYFDTAAMAERFGAVLDGIRFLQYDIDETTDGQWRVQACAI